MLTAHVTLTDTESRIIQDITKSTGRTLDDVLHEAIEQFIARSTSAMVVKPTSVFPARMLKSMSVSGSMFSTRSTWATSFKKRRSLAITLNLWPLLKLDSLLLMKRSFLVKIARKYTVLRNYVNLLPLKASLVLT